MVVQISRLADGSRRITSIAEVRGMDAQGNYDCVEIFKLGNLIRNADGNLKGDLEPTGEVPTFIEEIENNRIPFSRDKFLKKSAA